MIRLQLKCVQGDYFDAWFNDREAFAAQVAKAQVGCPHCGETVVLEAPVLKPGVYSEISEDQARQMACDTRRMLEGWIGHGGLGEALANDPAKTQEPKPEQADDAARTARPVRPSRHVAYDC
ncbi:MAG: DUF1178 family protein [Rhodospirillales bacterium]